MNSLPATKLASLRLWGGLYLLCYGVLLEVVFFAARYETPFRWAYWLALFGFSTALSWRFSNWVKPVVKFAWPLVFVIGIGVLAVGLFYLPWFVPTYYGNVRFGWSEQINSVLASLYKLSLIIGGACFFTSHLFSLARRSEPERRKPEGQRQI